MLKQPITIDKAIKNAAASIEMEGFLVTAQYHELCKRLLSKEITFAEYMKAVTAPHEAQT